MGGEIAFIVIAFTNTALLDQAITLGWDQAGNDSKTLIQNTLVCCGLLNVTDRPALPCPNGTTTGCYPAIQEKVDSYYLYVEIAGYCLLGLEAVILLFTLLFVCNLMTDEEKRQKQLDEARKLNREMNDYA